MKIFHRSFIFIAISVFIYCCQESFLVSPVTPLTDDEFIQHITSCVILKLDSLNDSYTLDQTINGYLSLINCCDLPFSLEYSNLPLSYCRIFNETDSLIASFPMIGMTVTGTITLLKGNMYKDVLVWNQEINSIDNIYGLKAYSGKYKFTANFGGNPLLTLPVIKRFEINEIGEPLSYTVKNEYPSKDSIRIHVTLRNRITQPITYYIDQQPAVEVLFVQNNSTIFTQRFNLPMQQVDLLPHSDNQIFRYLASKKDTVFAGMKGYFDVKVNITFRNKIISGKITTAL